MKNATKTKPKEAERQFPKRTSRPTKSQGQHHEGSAVRGAIAPQENFQSVKKLSKKILKSLKFLTVLSHKDRTQVKNLPITPVLILFFDFDTLTFDITPQRENILETLNTYITIRT